jgi:hypothetical protein
MVERTDGGGAFGGDEFEGAEWPGERHIVSDEVEAEHMAHAMDPHYERASKIEQISRDARDVRDEQVAKERDDQISEEAYEQGSKELQTQAQDEAASAIHRDVYVGEERIALDEAAKSARRAGDSVGELESQVYRRKRRPPST